MVILVLTVFLILPLFPAIRYILIPPFAELLDLRVELGDVIDVPVLGVVTFLLLAGQVVVRILNLLVLRPRELL